MYRSASELQMPKNEIQFSTFFFQLSPIVGNNMVICVFRFVCVWRFSRPNIFFSLCWANFFLYVTYREIWIIVTLYWAWHWSRRNRCALQPSRRVYHKSRTLFFLCIIIFLNFQNEWGEKSIYFRKKGKHISNKKGKWGW